MVTKPSKKKSTYINYIYNVNLFDIANQRINGTVSGSTVIVPHVCNNINVFGGGFSGAISSRYPEVEQNYRMLGNQMRLGHTQFISVVKDKIYDHEIIIANMIAQNKTINSFDNPRPINYAALVECMINVKFYIQNLLDKKDKTRVEIHAPKFGSGLAGGDWNFIEDLIEDIWTGLHISIYSLNNRK